LLFRPAHVPVGRTVHAPSGPGPHAALASKTNTGWPSGWPASRVIASISSAARSNSPSESTGVPSNGRSRWSSSQELQPPYSSRTFTVTGRGIL